MSKRSTIPHSAASPVAPRPPVPPKEQSPKQKDKAYENLRTAARLKRRLLILSQMAELNKEYSLIDSKLPLEMSHSSACSQLDQQLEFLVARTPVYLESLAQNKQ